MLNNFSTIDKLKKCMDIIHGNSSKIIEESYEDDIFIYNINNTYRIESHSGYEFFIINEDDDKVVFTVFSNSSMSYKHWCSISHNLDFLDNIIYTYINDMTHFEYIDMNEKKYKISDMININQLQLSILFQDPIPDWVEFIKYAQNFEFKYNFYINYKSFSKHIDDLYTLLSEKLNEK